MNPQDPFLDEDKALACVHCGLCLGSCPTYLETGNENDSPRGRIYLMRSIQNGRLSLNGGSSPVTHLDRCLGCRACETACPSGVAYGQLLESTRDHVEHHATRSLYQRFLRRWVIDTLFPVPWRFRLATWPAMLIKRMGLESYLPARFRDALELLPDTPSHASLPALAPCPVQPSRGKVGLISGCVMPVLYGKTHLATIRMIHRLGFDVVIPPDQRCCGALHAHGGQLAKARNLARHNLQVFEDQDCDHIVVNAAGCGSTLKEYEHLLAEEPGLQQQARAFTGKVRDYSEWIMEAGCEWLERLEAHRRDGWTPPAPLDGPTTFHDACHLAHAQKITEWPRRWVRAVAGDHYVNLPEADICCGSAGSYNLTEPELALSLQQRKVRHIQGTKASLVVTTNPGCILQIRAGLLKQGFKEIEVMHLADYLDQALESLAVECQALPAHQNQ
jgi:glycolate oxidase iron-sulfur subunit